MDFLEILKEITMQQASDIFIIPGRPLTYKVNGQLNNYGENLTPGNCNTLVSEIYKLAGDRDISVLKNNGDDDFSFAVRGVSRFRASAFMQRGTISAVVRVISFTLPDPEDLMIPDAVMNLADSAPGMVLVTGPAGSGKSTTLACIIDKINSEQTKHIITLEDPLEYLHHHKKSIVSQREINTDTKSYITALRAALRQSPDVILLGEMRDYETINTAVSAAETGHLLFSTLHTVGAANTIDRIIDIFPSAQQRQIAVQLSMLLRAVVSQRLLPSVDGKMVPVFEIMEVTPAIQNLIREGKTHQIESIIYASNTPGMIGMDSYILKLYNEGTIDRQTALSNAGNPDMLERKMKK